ncbi:MAG: hypothetical protein PHZ00_05145 [Candidatus Peribacteraceae bacterium]|nr:hypothetical protein [Candidatus Peribacteraceae bacterium]
MTKRTRFAGFTLVEVAVTLGLAGVLGSVMIPTFFSYQAQNDLSATVSQVVQALGSARIFSQSNKQDSPWGFRVAEGVLFQGSSFASRNTSADVVFPLPETVTASGLREAVFTQISGRVVEGGVILLTAGNGDQVAIVIDADGLEVVPVTQDIVDIAHSIDSIPPASSVSSASAQSSVGDLPPPPASSVSSASAESSEAAASSTSSEAVSSVASSLAIVPPSPQEADLSIEKTAAVSSIVRGTNAVYSLVVTNTSSTTTASSVTVTDPVPTDHTYLSFTSTKTGVTCSVTDGTVQCSVGTLAPSEVATIILTFSAATQTPCTQITSVTTNTATVAGDVSDPVSTNDSSSTTITLTCPILQADLSIVKTASASSIVRGMNAFYSLVVTNTSTTTAAPSVTVTDPVPTDHSFVSFASTKTGVTCSATGGTVQCSVGTIAPSEVATITLTFSTAPQTSCMQSESVTNTATVAGAVSDSASTNDSSSVTVSLICPASSSSSQAMTPLVWQDQSVGILLLDPSSLGALTLSGNGSMRITNPDATVVVDSSNTAAVKMSGNASIWATTFNITGDPGVQRSGNARIIGVVRTGIAPTADPFIDLPALVPPTQTFSRATVSGNSSVTLNPGTYIGGIAASANARVTLSPGIYYLQGGGLSLSGNATVTGNGVMIYNAPVQSTHKISISGNANLTISPITSGSFAGISIFQSRGSAVDMRISGNGTLNMDGVLYMPNALLDIPGNGNVNLQCLSSSRFIVKELHFSGNGTFNVQ